MIINIMIIIKNDYKKYLSILLLSIIITSINNMN